MVPLTRSQRRRRAVVERGIAVAAPALDALLWAGDRLSRIVEGDDPSYDPPRSPAPDSPVRRGTRPV